MKTAICSNITLILVNLLIIISFNVVADGTDYGPLTNFGGSLRSEYPTNGSTGIKIYPYLYITISDPHGYNFDINWTTKSLDGSWFSFATNTSCTNGTYYQRATWANQSLTKYYWNVSVNNLIGNSASFSFTTDDYSLGDWSDWWIFDCSLLEDLAILSEYPVNCSIEETRPVNLSAFVEGSVVDIYIYFYNMTPITDTWTLVASWNNQTDGRLEANLANFGRTTEFVWGNTTYVWSVNITDGNQWLNYTYCYTTQSSILGENARYDTNVDLINIDVLDLSVTWGRRTFDGTWIYDGLYDVNNDNQVDVLDISLIWKHNTINDVKISSEVVNR